MKEKIVRYVHEFRVGAREVLRLHPIESALIVLLTAVALLTYEMEWEHVVPRLAVTALFVLLTLAVNILAGRGAWRKVYWVCWTPLIALVCWSGLEGWVESWRFAMTAGVLTPLAVALSRHAVQNDRFICDTLVWIRAAVLAVVFANVAFGLFCAILYSTTYIFGLEGAWIEHVTVYALIFTQALAVPVLLLMMYDRWGGSECLGSRIVEVLLNYIVTPALLIYTAILYLYIFKIVATWTLPRGGVAYLVFGFMILATGVQALQFLLQSRIYNWFFNRFALISLPALVLFWAGVVHRTEEYGLTAPRVYLLVCGGVMTLFMLLFLWRRTGRYLYVCLAALVTFGALTYIPALEPERIAVRSQEQRAERIAGQLGLLDEAGKILPERITEADSVRRGELRKCFESLQYLEYRDTAAFARFGLKDTEQLVAHLPVKLKNAVQYGWEIDDRPGDYDNYVNISQQSGQRFNIEGYRELIADISRWDDSETPNYKLGDSLVVDFGASRAIFRIACDSLARMQLRKAGLSSSATEAELEQAAPALLFFEQDEFAIQFANMQLERRDTVWTVDNAAIGFILVR